MVEPEQSVDANLDNLEEKGRGIFFHHHPESDLPIRDTKFQEKTEPYIEFGAERGLNDDYIVGAENFCAPCYQPAVRFFVESDEKYLFLLTNPQHLDMDRAVVGYIRKEDYQPHDDGRVSVSGKTRLFSFDDSIPAAEFGKRTKAPLGGYGEVFNEEDTEEILAHFETCDDVTEEALSTILDRSDETQTSSRSTNSGC